jgi:hypothetical protein
MVLLLHEGSFREPYSSMQMNPATSGAAKQHDGRSPGLSGRGKENGSYQGL